MIPLYSETDKGREIHNEEASHRNAFRRDNGRLIHSPAFRRLQGKTQLFPGYESDFFRNRLTHSIEVAQIAKGIAEKLNNSNEYFTQHNIDLDLVETAALAHDLGHPPFGHNGERGLDDCMKHYGGFEGNAQTLRILSKLEKKYTYDNTYFPVKEDGTDNRCGLNLTYRTLASILKYDNKISLARSKNTKVEKGYYYTESDIVEAVKANVQGDSQADEFSTIECQIMDIADDISYSTYDLEDAFKAEFLSPISILNADQDLLEKVLIKVRKYTGNEHYKVEDVRRVLIDIYSILFGKQDLIKIIEEKSYDFEDFFSLIAGHSHEQSNRILNSGYFRTEHTSGLVKDFLEGVEVSINENCPALSKIYLSDKVKLTVEVLKNYTYEAMIMSPRLKIVEFRSYDIVKEIFDTIGSDDSRYYGPNLLPNDFRELYEKFGDDALKKRVICDFIAGMTDRYAVEFYGRLKSENPQSIFKPF